MELSKRAKRVWAVVLTVTSVLAALAGGTNALDTLLAKGRAVGPPLWRAVTPFILPAVILYGATAVLLTLYSEWRQRESARARDLRNELANILRTIKTLAWQIESSAKDGMVAYNDFYYPLLEVKSALVAASLLERRSSVFNVANNMEKLCIARLPATIPQTDLAPFLAAFQAWAKWAEWELNPQELGRPIDPFAPRR